MADWERCGNSSFWRGGWVGLTSLMQTFVDPVDLVIVESYFEKDAIGVRRERPPEITRKILEAARDEDNPEVYRHFIVWLDVVVRTAKRKDFKHYLLRRFANASSEVRDNVLEAISRVFNRTIDQWTTDKILVPLEHDALWEALGKFGVFEC